MDTAPRRLLQPVPWTQVRITGGFWGPRLETNRTTTLPIEYRQCKDTGRIDAFRLDWRPGQPDPPHIFWDSDVAKWIEAACYSLATHPDPALQAQVDEVVDLVVTAQQADGYLNVHFTVVEPDQRWANLRDWHELYCAGHLMEAAVAHHQATGRRDLLDCLARYGDYIGQVFGRGAGQLPGYCGHEEVELALVKLYRATGERRYLDLAAYFVDERGAQPHFFDEEARRRGEDPGQYVFGKYDYCQAHQPVREQTTAEGHSVRAMYLYCGMADVAAETGDEALLAACRALFDNVAQRRLYLTGGIGSAPHGERFTRDWDLPNATAYAETCAAIGLVLFAHRMLQVEADARYADVLEQALYNGVLSGIDEGGTHFFYANPLAVDPRHHPGPFSPVRQEWFGCACCPPNLARLLASLGEYVSSTSADELFVHLFVDGTVCAPVAGAAAQLTVRTSYPWGESVQITVDDTPAAEWTLALRVPGWCRAATARVNGQTAEVMVERGYAKLRRRWQSGDVVEWVLPMPVRRVYAHPDVRADVGRVALMRGPLVYCLEEADNGLNLDALVLPRDAELTARHDPDLLRWGAVVVEGEAQREVPLDGVLYSDAPLPSEPAKLRAVPYALWQNRGQGEMLVWIRE